MKKLFYFCLFTFAFLFLYFPTFSQTLTVRDIMAEPSIAGMRPDAEKLSPDGKYVVFAWNAEGKEPHNLFIVNSEGGEPRILVNAEQNYEPRPEPPSSKLNYGLNLRDDFTKEREKNLFGVEFSPDSKRILFLQNSDIYVLDLEEKTTSNTAFSNEIKEKWAKYETAITRRVDLIPEFIKALQTADIQETESFAKIADARTNLLNALNELPKGENGNKSDEQRQIIISDNNILTKDLDTIETKLLKNSNPTSLKTSYSNSDESFEKVFDEILGVENRIKNTKLDYNDAVSSSISTKPRRITRTQGFESAARWLDNDSILYQSNGNYFVLNLKETAITQVTKEGNPQAFITIQNVAASKDGKMLAYAVSDGSKQRALFVPNYLDEFVQAPTTRRGFADQKILAATADGRFERPFEIKLPKPEGAGYIRSIRWAADNRSLIVDRIDKDTKRRQLFYVYDVGSKAEQTILVTEETDDKWVAGLSRIVEPNPKDNSQILFASERDGFNHLYLATLERAKPQPNPNGESRQENPTDAGFTANVKTDQLTKGNFEIDWAKWTANGEQIIFSSTEENTAERQFYALVGDGKKKMKINASEKGMLTNPQLDEINSQPILLYEYSQWNQPNELYAVKVCPTCRGLFSPNQLTKTTPESFKRTAWNEPKFIDIPAKDGKKIKAKIYLPDNYGQNREKQIFPMVIFVHGAGYLQNVINGWNNYYREFMFNEILVKKGYVVLDIDYRGSAGYGREWRTDVYDFLGGLDMQDHLDAIDFAVKNYAVDPNKIGVYGGSYGGFMAEMMAFRTDKINCAAALRPVADWKNYYASSPVYTAERLGFPDKNPEGYKRSSPISYADKLNKPLLILHGIVDDNVHVQDSMQLTEKLIRLEKTPYFEEMFYPAENHGFTRPTSWTDEYTRILNFFDKHLK